jgi:hypothetical protein
MRCKDVIEILGEAQTGRFSPAIEEHLSDCASCQDAWKDLRLLRAGLRALAQEQPPEASIGFAMRVVRRLEESLDSRGRAAEFLEKVGRRFVFATSMLTLFMLLGLVLPSSGPFRGPASDEPYLAQPEPRMQSEGFALAYETADTRDTTPLKSTNGSDQKQK